MSPALAGVYLSTVPSGRSLDHNWRGRLVLWKQVRQSLGCREEAGGGGWEGRVGEGGFQKEGGGGGLAPSWQHVLTAGSAGRKGWGLQEGTGSCRERGPSPEHRPRHEAGRGKDGNEHPLPQPALTFLALRAGGRCLWGWWAKGQELALWREPDTWVPLTLPVERDKGEMGNLQVLGISVLISQTLEEQTESRCQVQ